MHHDELQARLTRASRTAAGDAPPAFLRTVTRRRWKRRLPAISAAVLVIAGAWTASLFSKSTPLAPPTPGPEPIAAVDAAPERSADASLAALRRDGLASRALSEIGPAPAASTAPLGGAERPLRAFEVSRVLRGL
jgi:hypothetical protein